MFFLIKRMKKEKKVDSVSSRHNQAANTLSERIHRHLFDIDSRTAENDTRSVRAEMEIRSESNLLKPTSDKTHRKSAEKRTTLGKKRSR